MALTDRAIGSGKWKKLRLEILDRDGRECPCGQPADTVDHIIPRVKGGEMWNPSNLQSMCKSCNSAKGSRFLSPRATPPVFPDSSLPETVRIVPDSPFIKPEAIQVNAD